MSQKSLVTRILESYYWGTLRSHFLRFTLNHQLYAYFCHRYNATWRNERTVEVPVIMSAINRATKSARILELGNVLTHYYPVTHTVVDKYEHAPGVINEDITTWKAPHKYDLIVSISTLEHVGWDEAKKDPTKIKQTVTKLQRLLTPRGKALLTFPLGYNPNLDLQLRNKTLTFDQLYFLQRVSLDNRWRQISERVLTEQPQYGHPFPNANVVCLAIVHPSRSK